MEKRVQSGGGGWTQVPARGARAHLEGAQGEELTVEEEEQEN